MSYIFKIAVKVTPTVLRNIKMLCKTIFTTVHTIKGDSDNQENPHVFQNKPRNCKSESLSNR